MTDEQAPLLAPGVWLYHVPGEGVVIEKGTERAIYSGDAAEALAAWIATGEAPAASTPEAGYARHVARTRWVERGWIDAPLHGARPAPPVKRPRAWDAVGFDPSARAFLAGLVPARSGQREAIRVLFAADYTDVVVRDEVAAAHADGEAVLLVRPYLPDVWIGPVLHPGEDLAPWRDALRRQDVLARWMEARGLVPFQGSEAFPGTTRASRVRRALARALAAGEATLTTLSVATGRRTVHRLPAPWPEGLTRPDAVPLLRRLVSPLTGVLTDLRRAPTLVGGVPHVVGHHPLTHQARDFHEAVTRHATPCYGKGLTLDQAEGSAIAEGVERYSGVYDGHETTRVATARATQDRTLDLAALQQFSARQYARRASNDGDPTTYVPEPLDPDIPFQWVAVHPVGGGEARFVPAAWAYYNVGDEGERFFVCTSNGTAAGVSFDDALAHALCELIERDAVAIWWYNRLRRPGVPASAFEHPYLQRLRGRLHKMGRQLWALDLTHYLGVPVVAAVTTRRRPPFAIHLGFGCALDRETALLRAATELVQALPGRRQPAGVPPVARLSPGDRWMQEASPDACPYLLPDPHRAPSLVDLPVSPSAREAVAHLVRHLGAAGLTPYVLDQTRPTVGVPVVRAIVPGLRHFWQRLGPGRLYDVPVVLGERFAPCDETELNPYPAFW